MVDINIKIKDFNSIITPFEYLGFEEYEINKELEDYLIRKISKYMEDDICINLYIKKSNNSQLKNVKSLIKNHFTNRAYETEMNLKEKIKQWRVNLTIGFLFFILCLMLQKIVGPFTYIEIMRILNENLIIISWVALTEPMTFLFFGWQNFRRDIHKFNKISEAIINVNTY